MSRGDGKGRLSKSKLPVLKTKELGKMGPAFGIGAGCGFGVGLGLIGGAGIGAGFPGLHFGFGVGVGCGVGVGFGYGVGKGIAHDGNRRYSNVGKLFQDSQNLPSREEIFGALDEFVVYTKRMVNVTSKEIGKWRR